MNKKEILLKKNLGQLRSLVVDATAVTGSLKILKLAEGWGGHSITYTTKKENQSTVTIKILSTIKWPYFLYCLSMYDNSMPGTFNYMPKGLITIRTINTSFHIFSKSCSLLKSCLGIHSSFFLSFLS